jgi:RHS repeat-associated protein
MKSSNRLIVTTSPKTYPTRKPRLTARALYRSIRRSLTGKEQDAETGLYYYGARYLDPRTGRWLSGDPAVSDYIPSAPVNDEVRKRNGSLPGQGGVFNYVNLHVYHYAGNNPVKYIDPDGREDEHHTTTFGPDPDSFSFKDTIANINSAANANLDQPYGDRNQCDDYLERVLDQGGVDPSNYLGGRANSTVVVDYQEKRTNIPALIHFREILDIINSTINKYGDRSAI